MANVFGLATTARYVVATGKVNPPARFLRRWKGKGTQEWNLKKQEKEDDDEDEDGEYEVVEDDSTSQDTDHDDIYDS